VRTPNERRMLLDAGQLALFVAMVVDLALPWWSRTEFRQPFITSTGWDLGESPNLGWVVIIAAVPLGLAWWLRRAWLSIAAASWALLVLIVFGVSTAHLDDIGDGHPHAGLVVGWLLVAITALLRIADVVVAKQVEERRP
jgi:hypothetical protein